jgi:DNA mismatch repair protein MSH5
VTYTATYAVSMIELQLCCPPADLSVEQQDREIEIVHQLGVDVLQHKDALIKASEICGELDSLVALARGAAENNWTAPEMTDANIIHIKGGRHPLQELVVSPFIANDCSLAGGSEADASGEGANASSTERGSVLPNMLVLTGPNHSGKSVYLKQIALIVYLAHVGSYVPADRATIGVTDRLLTRVSTRESVSRSESAFSIDLRQAAFTMKFATRKSLVLIDEFGKGTGTQNGAGLLAALLNHFQALELHKPKVLVASHFHEIFQGGIIDESQDVKFAHMNVRVDTQAPDAQGQVTYLFQLVPGREASSFGTVCAAMNGVDQAVVDRAVAILGLIRRKENLQATCAWLSEKEQQELEAAEGAARRFLEMDFLHLEASRGSITTRGRDDTMDIRNMLQEVVPPRSGENPGS